MKIVHCEICNLGFKVHNASSYALCPSCSDDANEVEMFNGQCGYARNDNNDIIEYTGMGANK